MIEDLRSYHDGAAFDADICIVGAGPAGLTLARELLGSQTRVLLLESGGSDWDPLANTLNSGENVGLDLPGLHTARARAFGGTTKLWGSQCARLDDMDFEARSWVPYSGWPISRVELDPFYDRAEEMLGLSPMGYGEGMVRSFDVELPRFDPDKLLHIVTQFTPRADLGQFCRGVFKRSENIRVLLHANVTKVVTTESGKAVKRVDVSTVDGSAASVQAPIVVLCAGGIENARLLLLSALGNSRDLVGRFFQEHPRSASTVLHTASPDSLRDSYGMLGRGRVKYLPKVSLAPAVQREKQVLNCVGDLVYDYDDGSVAAHLKKFYYALKARRRPRDIGRSGLHLLRHLDQVAGVAFQRYLRGRLSAPYPRHVRLQIWLEQAPNPMSRVTLSDERDVLGLRKARVDWRLSELERRTARTMLRTVDAELGRLGIARLSGTEWLDEDDWAEQFHEGRHHMGTTRMADSPEDGVVDVNCRVHDVDGLYVCGSSVFPSSGYANPTLTILAMAVRLADHLKREARR